MIVKTDGYTRDQAGKVIQLRATVEGLKLGKGVIDWLATEGRRARCGMQCAWHSSPVLIAFAIRYALQLLTPASILVQMAGRSQIELKDIGEMTELFLDAKTSVRNLAKGEF